MRPSQTPTTRPDPGGLEPAAARARRSGPPRGGRPAPPGRRLRLTGADRPWAALRGLGILRGLFLPLLLLGPGLAAPPCRAQTAPSDPGMRAAPQPSDFARPRSPSAPPASLTEAQRRRSACVVIEKAQTIDFLASISVSFTPFIRQGDVYVARYDVRVFPYFFYDESGSLRVALPEADLVRIDRGQPVPFEGAGISQDGQSRRFSGVLIPNGPADRANAGRIQVRVFISRRISIPFETTYALTGRGR